MVVDQVVEETFEVEEAIKEANLEIEVEEEDQMDLSLLAKYVGNMVTQQQFATIVRMKPTLA